jgi:hypothetical protein
MLGAHLNNMDVVVVKAVPEHLLWHRQCTPKLCTSALTTRLSTSDRSVVAVDNGNGTLAKGVTTKRVVGSVAAVVAPAARAAGVSQPAVPDAHELLKMRTLDGSHWWGRVRWGPCRLPTGSHTMPARSARVASDARAGSPPRGCRWTPCRAAPVRLQRSPEHQQLRSPREQRAPGSTSRPNTSQM